MIEVAVPAAFAPEATHAVSEIAARLGVPMTTRPADQRHVEMTRPGHPGRLVFAPGLFALPEARRLDAAAVLPAPPLPTWDAREVGWTGAPLPVLHGTAEPARRDGGALRVGADLLGTWLFLTSRWDEVAQPDAADAHGRFPSADTLAVRAGFADRPLADEAVEVLSLCLRDLWPDLPAPGHTYRVALSCDLDRPWLFPSRRFAGRALLSLARQRRWSDVLDASAHLARGVDPWGQGMRRLVALAEAHGLRLEVNVMAAAPGPRDVGYDPAGQRVRRVLDALRQGGHRIGIHPGYETFTDPGRLPAEKARLEAAVGAPVSEGRHHYLRLRLPEGWRRWRAAGLTVDGSLGFADRCGFRAGTCHPYRPFDLLAREPLDLTEEPLIVMDGALKDPTAEGLSPEAAIDRIDALAARCRAVGGVFSLLWHNSSFALDWRPWERVLEQGLARAVAGRQGRE